MNKEHVINYGIGEKDKNGIQREYAKQAKEKSLKSQFRKTAEDVCGTKSWP